MVTAASENRLLSVAERTALLPLKLRDGLLRLAFPLVAESFVEHQRKDVVLVILPRSLATQDVGCAPQVRFQLLQGEFHLLAYSAASGWSSSRALAAIVVRLDQSVYGDVCPLGAGN